MIRLRSTIAAAAVAVLCFAAPALAVTKTVVLGSTYAAAPPGGSPGSIAATNADFFSGAGSWYKATLSPKFEMYVDPVATFGSTFTIDQIASISYHTRNNGNPSGVDFYPLIYTAPFAGGDASWYGRRIQGEPYLSNGYAPSTSSWNTWTTAPGPNQLTLWDSNHTAGSFGWYGAPTLADLQAGPITWSTWPGAPAGSDPTAFDYGPLTVGLLSFQTGSGWASFAGYIDAISVTLTNGDVYNLELENVGDNAVSAAAPATCITAAHPCVTVPVNIARTDLTGIRGYSVTVQVAGDLALCGGTTADITQGTYLSGAGSTNYQVTDNGGGSYTVDCAILGTTTGATGTGGNLFNLSLKQLSGDGTGTVSVTSVTLRDPNNNPLLATAGASASVTVDFTSPAAVSGLAATQVKTGNDADGTTKIQLAFTAPAGTSVEVYRAGYGHYPDYDEAGGAVPAAPAYPPSGAWTLTGVTASGQADEPPTRDFWYYVAFAKDGCGNVSTASTLTTGTLNYHLGDVVDASNVSPYGDNQVDGGDISRLGAHYGITLPVADPYEYLDVGPTTNYSVNARPTTDHKVGFEDLMMFAINYNVVAAPQFALQRQPATRNALALDVPELPAVGGTFAVPVRMQGAGNVQGASVRLTWDAAVVEPVGVEAGDLLQGQRAASLVLSPEPGTVDVALLGSGMGLAGEGEVARVLFRVKGAGAPAIGLGSVTARDAKNQPVDFGPLPAAGGPQTPLRTEMGTPYPNPFGHTAALRLSLAREGTVKVAVYDLAGRRVRTLMDSVQPAGTRLLAWDGRSDGGLRMSAGVYVVRMEADGVTQSRRLQFVP